MKLGPVLLVASLSLAAVTVVSSAPTPKYSPQQIARGKYLVTDVGVCQDCHTPRNAKGKFIQKQWLAGAPVFVKPAIPIPVWADKAVNLAGLPGWTDQQAIKFFMTGIAYNGLRARPPMPQYRFSRADATAIVAYLRSLKSSSSSEQQSADSTSK